LSLKYSPFLKSYGFSILLIASILLGAGIGIIMGRDASALKPLGDIFLNLLFTAIIPLVFFSITSAISGMNNIRRLGKIISAMLVVFVLAGIVASVIMIGAVIAFPPFAGIHIDFNQAFQVEKFKTSDQIVRALTASDFPEIISKKNMLALIIFSMLVGIAASLAGEKGKAFSNFLSSANAVMMKLISVIMYYAPVGLCAYFAYLVGTLGPELLGSYMNVILLYYPVAILYFFIVFSAYVYIAARGTGLKRFWKNIIPPSLTALATGSSMVTIPVNLEAAEKTGVPKDISEIVIPVGASMHMEGSCLAAVLKIAFLFGLFQMKFAGLETLLTALGIALLTGMVVSGIPGGGMIGEILIITLYGFPLETFPIITMIGTLVDAPATMVNAVGDNVCSMLVARILGGRNWISEGVSKDA
jgi:Na+/H+-dicarboxylate symporter